jgi:hypothetical protein
MRLGAQGREAYLVGTNRFSGDAMATLIDINRVTAILLQPAATWKTIDGEFTNPAKLYRGWILPLAAIGPVCMAVGMVIFGLRIPLVGLTYRVPITTALTQGAVEYVLNVVVVFFLALVVNLLAPTFDGTKNSVQALKVAAYSSTAWWVAGAFYLIPALALVGVLVSLYSLYLLYAGLPVVMKAPRDKAVGYVVVVVIAAVVFFLLKSAISEGLVPASSGLRPRA